MPAKSIANLLQQVQQADVNSEGVVQWDGVNGQEQLESDIIDTLGARGILYFNSLDQLSVAGGSDSGYAVAPNADGVINFYKFFPVVASGITGAITSSSAGQWRPIFAINDPSTSGVWIEGDTNNDIVPNTAYLNSSVAIRKDAADDGLVLDISALDEDGLNPKATRISTMSTANMNSLTPPVNNSLIVNQDDKMLLRCNSADNSFKSASVLAGTESGNLTMGAGSFSVVGAIGTQHVNTYKIYITATNAYSAAILAGGYYVTKTTTQFNIFFTVAAGSTGTFAFDWQISH